MAAGKIIPVHPEIVKGNVRKLRTPCTFPDRPDIRRRRLQLLIDFDIAALRQLDSRQLQANTRKVFGVRPVATSRCVPLSSVSLRLSLQRNRPVILVHRLTGLPRHASM